MVFGREPDELNLGTPSERVSGIPGADKPTATSTPAAGPTGPYVPGRGLLSLFTVAVLAAGAFMFVTLERRAVDDPVKKAERGEIKAGSDLAMTEEANVRRALQVVDAQLDEGGFIDTVRIAPENMQATIVRSDGLRQILIVNLAFDVNTIDSGSDPDKAGLQIKDLDPAVPSKILRVARRKFGLQLENVNYVTTRTAFADGPVEWSAFWSRPLRDNAVVAAQDGTDVRLLGTPDAATRRAQREAKVSADRATRDARRRAECLRNARSAQALLRCTS